MYRNPNISDLTHFRVALQVIDRTLFSTTFQAVGGTWTHMVLNYIGPEHGQGIRIYYNGVKLDGGSYKTPPGKPTSAANGSVTVGKFKNCYYSVTIDYSTVALDELLFYNVKLTSHQIRELYNQGFP